MKNRISTPKLTSKTKSIKKILKILKILLIILVILIAVTVGIIVVITNEEQHSIKNAQSTNAEGNVEEQEKNQTKNVQNTNAEENIEEQEKDQTEDKDIFENENKEESLFKGCYSPAEEKLKEMTLEEKVSQMFMARCPASGQIEQISLNQPGGYILFGRDFEGKTKQEVTNEIQSYQEASKIPMIIGVDEEGRHSM